MREQMAREQRINRIRRAFKGSASSEAILATGTGKWVAITVAKRMQKASRARRHLVINAKRGVDAQA